MAGFDSFPHELSLFYIVLKVHTASIPISMVFRHSDTNAIIVIVLLSPGIC